MDSDSDLSSAPSTPSTEASEASPTKPTKVPVEDQAAPPKPPLSSTKGAKKEAAGAKSKPVVPRLRASARKALPTAAVVEATDDEDATQEPAGEEDDSLTTSAGKKRRASAANTIGAKKLKVRAGASSAEPTNGQWPEKTVEKPPAGPQSAKGKGVGKKGRQSLPGPSATEAESSEPAVPERAKESGKKKKETKTRWKRRIVEPSPEESDGERDSGPLQTVAMETSAPEPTVMSAPTPLHSAPTPPGRETDRDSPLPSKDVDMALRDAQEQAADAAVKDTESAGKNNEVDMKGDAPLEEDKSTANSKPVKKTKANLSPVPPSERRTVPDIAVSSTAKAGESSDTPPLAGGAPDPTKAKVASAVPKKKAALIGATGKSVPVGSPATEGPGSAPRMSGLLANTLAALTQTPSRIPASDKKKEPKPVVKKKITAVADWSDWVMTAEQKKKYDASVSEREAMRADFAKWKANAVNLQEAKDAYKLDAVQPREIPLPHGVGVGIKTDQRSRPSVVIQAMIDSAR